jgi:hypothetical protein
LLNGSWKRVWTTRGEYWLEASWMINSETEKAMPAKEIVAPAITPSRVLALSTVEVNPSGRSASVVSTRRSTASAARPRTVATITATIGTKNRLERSRSSSELIRRFIGAPRWCPTGRGEGYWLEAYFLALLLAFDDALSGSLHHLLAAVFLARVERFKLSWTVWVELVSACDGRVVDPVSGDG